MCRRQFEVMQPVKLTVVFIGKYFLRCKTVFSEF